ncbi:probable HSV2 Phosphatidylinositol 3,5-bisphosphate-binding protein [Phialocephala subalpina]|uniref:Probable HSV2 Phosphatidylinositol 3,5-bisphosphate-binding protein n=1 Tax=Phialocephala subalpina TaxID=576137 RepID=A0A1L7XFM0_9HELO|nr:probable HSV2 Phosphatidylinositol 3,5-bisphosphate-binding protein [Phialocephala subalpina]
MNTRPAIESSSNPSALSASFNQDASCFAIGLDTGFCIFDSEPCQLRVSRDFNAGIGAVQMLGKANFIALIGGGKLPKFPQNKVIIWDDAKQKVAIQLPVLTAVRGVRLSRTHIVVALQNSIRVYKFQSPPDLWAVFETADNPHGLCCLTSKTLAFPGRTPGQVQLVELSTGNVSIIPAHTSSLRAIDISQDGEVLATASETGTLIRIFATSNCARITEKRRGVDHATIFSLAISPSGQLLAVTSDKSTLHIFDIPHPSKPARSASPNRRLTTMGNGGGSPVTDGEVGQKWGILSRIPLLPRVFSDDYSFASVHFEIGDEPLYGGSTPLNSEEAFRPPKGIIGWTSDHSIIVIGAGRDGRWEKFVIAEGEDGKRYCVRDGWKRYLGAN